MTIQTHALEAYSAGIAADIGTLMPQLSERFDDEPIPEQRLQRIISSPDRDLLVAVDTTQNRAIGAATMNIVMGTGKGEEGWLEDFVVDSSYRGKGVADLLWNSMISWCEAHHLPSMALQTKPSREAAIRFYTRHGAQLVPGTTTHYRVPVEAAGSSTHVSIPREVLSSFGLETTVSAKKLTGGLVNQTLQIGEGSAKSILQKLSPVFGTTPPDATVAVAEELGQYGWEVPQPQYASNGKAYTTDLQGSVWRRSSFIESDGKIPETCTTGLVTATASLLGKWHRDMASSNYEPVFALPHFHDTEYYAEQLRAIRPKLPAETAVLADEFLQRYADLPALPNVPAQLIHGDPKLDNMLYRAGKPFTLIDFDTVMRGSTWLDVGDLLRSLAGKRQREGGALDKSELAMFSEAYYFAAQPDATLRECRTTGLLAGQTIALELGMRYLNDIIDDSYFAWNAERYQSRHDNHLDRAKAQLQIADMLQSAPAYSADQQPKEVNG